MRIMGSRCPSIEEMTQRFLRVLTKSLRRNSLPRPFRVKNKIIQDLEISEGNHRVNFLSLKTT